MSKFIKVTDSRYGDDLLINVDSIAWIHPDGSVVCFSGVHGEQHGLLTFNKENMQKILDATDTREGDI